MHSLESEYASVSVLFKTWPLALEFRKRWLHVLDANNVTADTILAL